MTAFSKLISTEKIASGAVYYNTPEAFFGRFGDALQATRCQILKYESRQFYHEDGDESFMLMKAGKLDEAIDLLRKTPHPDREAYEELSQRKVEFVRLRPVICPLNDYMKWEFESYKRNISLGERIFLVNFLALRNIFDEYALHDFMVFDARFAMIHHHDSDGNCIGGWWIEDQASILDLLFLFSFIRANASDARLIIE